MTQQVFTWMIPAIAIALIGIAFFAPRKEDQRKKSAQTVAETSGSAPLRITFAPAVFEPPPVAEPTVESSAERAHEPAPPPPPTVDAWTRAYESAGFADAATAMAALAGGTVPDGETLLRLAYAEAHDTDARATVLRVVRHGRWVLASDIAHAALADPAPRVRALAIDVFEAFGDSAGMRAALVDPLVPIAARAAFALSGIVAPDIYEAALAALGPDRARAIRETLDDAML